MRKVRTETALLASAPGLLLASALSLLLPASAEAYQVVPLVLEGDAVSDRGGASFMRFDVSPVVNDARTVAFVADLASGSEGAFTFSAGQDRVIALQGETAPGAGAGYCFFDHAPAINASGVVAFPATFGLPDCRVLSGVGLFKVAGSAVDLVQTTDPAPGTGGEEFCSFEQQASINDAGTVAFFARFQMCISLFLFTGASSGIFQLSGVTVSPVALPGPAAPGTGGTFVALGGAPSLNDTGEVAFLADVLTLVGVEPDIEEQIDRGIFLQAAGGVAKIAFPGDPAGSAGVFSSFEETGVTLNDSLQVAFNAKADDTSGLFLASNGTADVVALSGDAVPDRPGEVFAGFPARPVINDDGSIAFLAFYGVLGTEANALSTGIFVWTEGTLAAVALTGDAAGGLVGKSFSGFPVSPGLNDLGDVAFAADLSGGQNVAHGLFLAQVPEPGAGALRLFALLALAATVRRRR